MSDTIASITSTSPDAALVVESDNHKVAIVLTNDALRPSGMVLSHEEWAGFLIKVIHEGPATVFHKVRQSLFLDDGK